MHTNMHTKQPTRPHARTYTLYPHSTHEYFLQLRAGCNKTTSNTHDADQDFAVDDDNDLTWVQTSKQKAQAGKGGGRDKGLVFLFVLVFVLACILGYTLILCLHDARVCAGGASQPTNQPRQAKPLAGTKTPKQRLEPEMPEGAIGKAAAGEEKTWVRTPVRSMGLLAAPLSSTTGMLTRLQGAHNNMLLTIRPGTSIITRTIRWEISTITIITCSTQREISIRIIMCDSQREIRTTTTCTLCPGLTHLASKAPIPLREITLGTRQIRLIGKEMEGTQKRELDTPIDVHF
jgi:hypothetical protein